MKIMWKGGGGGYDVDNLGVWVNLWEFLCISLPHTLDKLHWHVLLWSLFENIRRQTTYRQTGLPLAPQYQGTDYTEDRQAFPWDSFQSTPGDRLHRNIEAFSWHPFQFASRQTTWRQTSPPLEPLSVNQGTDYTKTSLPPEPLSEHWRQTT